jgi:hypothetical protein
VLFLQLEALLLVKLVDGLALERVFAAPGAVVQAEDGDEFALLDREADVAQGVEDPALERVDFFDVTERDHGGKQDLGFGVQGLGRRTTVGY